MLGASAIFIIVDSKSLILEDGYRVEVSAPFALNWTLWIPRPSNPMETETAGTVYSMSTAVTQYGTMYNITGMGDVIIDQSLERHITSAEAPNNHLYGNVDYSGRNTTGRFTVWRASADPSSSISIDGFISHATRNRYSSVDCGGGGYSGDVQEGWSEPGEIHVDCGFPIDRAPLLSAFLFIAALVCGIAAVAVKSLVISPARATPVRKESGEGEDKSPQMKNDEKR